MHVKPAAKAAKVILPLLAVHGWPGSFWEYHKALPLLTEPDENGIAFEVIVPSIPGYGYSEAPKQKGMLLFLRYERFVIKSAFITN